MSSLEGCRVLLVEDESLVAMLAEDMLLDLGCEVVIAMRLDRALAAVRAERFDLAVLDVNLGDARSYPIADLLFACRTPFLFATGYGQEGLEGAYRAVPVMQKPYQAAQMEHLLVRLRAGSPPDRSPGALQHGAGCDCRGGGGWPRDGRFRAETLG